MSCRILKLLYGLFPATWDRLHLVGKHANQSDETESEGGVNMALSRHLKPVACMATKNVPRVRVAG